MIRFDFEKECYSCASCADHCGAKAISMNQNQTPVVDEKKCTSCGLCERVCVRINLPEPSSQNGFGKGYVLKNKSDEIRKSSSSGGVFFELAKAVLKEGGFVCGCVYDENLMPRHVVTDQIDECRKMMGSKYVQSDLTGVYSEIKKLTSQGKKVLFTGVPCQIAAAKRAVKENLITVAVVCHGSIGRDMWAKFLKEEEALHGRIRNVTMRDKSKGYLNYGLKFSFEDGSERITYRSENGYFLKSFTDGLFQRERCLACEYKADRIESDLILGDAWGMDRIFPEFVDSLGASAVLVKTKQGENLLDSVRDFFEIKEISSEVIVKNNPRIATPAPKNPFRDSFLKRAVKEGANLHHLTERFAKVNLKNRVLWKLAKLFSKR